MHIQNTHVPYIYINRQIFALSTSVGLAHAGSPQLHHFHITDHVTTSNGYEAVKPYWLSLYEIKLTK